MMNITDQLQLEQAQLEENINKGLKQIMLINHYNELAAIRAEQIEQAIKLLTQPNTELEHAELLAFPNGTGTQEPVQVPVLQNNRRVIGTPAEEERKRLKAIKRKERTAERKAEVIEPVATQSTDLLDFGYTPEEQAVEDAKQLKLEEEHELAKQEDAEAKRHNQAFLDKANEGKAEEKFQTLHARFKPEQDIELVLEPEKIQVGHKKKNMGEILGLHT